MGAESSELRGQSNLDATDTREFELLDEIEALNEGGKRAAYYLGMRFADLVDELNAWRAHA